MSRRRTGMQGTIGDRRTEILHCAQDMFAERGYAQATTRELAERAEVSEGLIFHHFGNKMGLLRALAAEGKPSRLLETFERAHDVPVANLPVLLAEAWLGDARDARLVAALSRDASYNPELREFVGGIIGSVLAGIGALLKARIEAGEFRQDLDIELASDIVQQLLLGHSISSTTRPPRTALVRQLELVFTAFRA